MEGCLLDGSVSHILVNGKIREHIISRVSPGRQTTFDLLSVCRDEMSVGKGRVVATTNLGLNSTFPTLPLWKQQKHGLDKPPVWMNWKL